jgi:hypothetical protein
VSRIAVVLALCACGGAPVAKPPPTVGVEPERDAFAQLRPQLSLATDGGTGWVAYLPPKANTGGKADGAYLFYSGDGKTFHQVQIDDVVDDESDSWNMYYIDPRFPVPAGELKLEKGAIIATCRGLEKKLMPLAQAEGQAQLKGTRLLPSQETWTAVALGRDTAGIFYYIDAGMADDNRDQIRLHMGTPGAMKEVPLIVADKRDWPNLRLVTQEGMLKVEVDSRGKLPSSTLWWTSSGRTNKVMVQDLDKPGMSPWTDLGIYKTQRGTTPCDGLQ